MFSAEIVLDSIDESRLTTFVLTYPRIIHSELLTHRVFSRNSASSRAIPFERMLEMLTFVPINWGKNQKGMVMKENEEVNCEDLWLKARDSAIGFAKEMAERGLHKGLVNRVVEPWMWITVIVTSSDFSNFFKLRCAPDAEVHIRRLAEMMRNLYEDSIPVERDYHHPLGETVRESVSNCAAVSYLKHTGSADIFDKLWAAGHFSPFEHQAKRGVQGMNGNLGKGWGQLRKYCEKGMLNDY